MPSNLTIQPTKPFKSSRLALPPSPFSPLFPLSSPPPLQAPSKSSHTQPRCPSPSTNLPPPPPEPLNWLWQCHLCNRVYRLAVTRRCLDDGHFFCSGMTHVKTSRKAGRKGKKVLRHKACASEFDYQGWKGWGVWRRAVEEERERARMEEEEEGMVELELDVPRPLFGSAARHGEEGRRFGGRWAKKEGEPAKQKKEKKDCWRHCDYPSECRWGKQYGVATPTLPPPPPPPPARPEPPTANPEKPAQAKSTFDDLLLTIPSSPSPSTSSTSSTKSDLDGNVDTPMLSPPLSPILPNTTPEEPTRKPSFDDLLESVKRRKRRSLGPSVEVPSPLSSHPSSPGTISMAEAMGFGGSGDGRVEHVEDAADQLAPVGGGVVQGQTPLERAFDGFDLEFRRSFGRAGAALTGFVSTVRPTALLEEEKTAEGYVKGLKKK